jgi:hypothetical protein
VKDVRRAHSLKPSRAAIVVTISLLAGFGCQRPPELRLRYLPQFDSASSGVFLPAKVAIALPSGEAVDEVFEAGRVVGPTGGVSRQLSVASFDQTLEKALVQGLSDAGLKPIALRLPDKGEPPEGMDFLLRTEILQLGVVKQLAGKTAAREQPFMVISWLHLKFALVGPKGETLFSKKIIGTETEEQPPASDKPAVPLKADPARALSVALSRTVGALLADPDFRRVLPAAEARRPAGASER